MTKQEPQATKPSLDAQYSAIYAAFRMAAIVLAVRFFLFLSLIGSFILAILAHNSQSTVSEAIMVIYACVTTLPLTLLELWRKRGS